MPMPDEAVAISAEFVAMLSELVPIIMEFISRVILFLSTIGLMLVSNLSTTTARDIILDAIPAVLPATSVPKL